MTDHHIPQLRWWAETLVVLPKSAGSGLKAKVLGAWRAVRRVNQCDVFVSANVRNALALGLFKRLTHRTTPLIVMTEMRLDDPRPGLRWRLKLALQRVGYSAVGMMCVSARAEAELYASRLWLPLSRFQFVPWHTNVPTPRYCPPSGGYLFAAGRTGRDWATLAEAIRGLTVPVIVVCSRQDAATVRFPRNVELFTEVAYDRYCELLEGAAAVVVPLESHTFSSGQVVILEAMALGKTVIATRVLGSEDYIVNGVDGLLVPVGSADQLREAITWVLGKPQAAERLGRAAVAKVLKEHTLDQYGRAIIATVERSARSSMGIRHIRMSVGGGH